MMNVSLPGCYLVAATACFYFYVFVSGIQPNEGGETVSSNNMANYIITRLLALGVQLLNSLDSQFQYVTICDWFEVWGKFFNEEA